MHDSTPRALHCGCTGRIPLRCCVLLFSPSPLAEVAWAGSLRIMPCCFSLLRYSYSTHSFYGFHSVHHSSWKGLRRCAHNLSFLNPLQICSVFPNATTQTIMASADPSATRRAPILLKALTDLRSIGPNTAASAKFVYEGPDAESREVVEATTQGKWLVVFGSLLPKPTWYGTRPVKVTITFDTQYPIEPPTIRLITPLFHPNVDDDGNQKLLPTRVRSLRHRRVSFQAKSAVIC